MRLQTWKTMGLPLFSDASLLPNEFDEHFRYPTLSHLDSISAGLFLAATKERWIQFSSWARKALGLVGGVISLGTIFLLPGNPGSIWSVLQFTLLAFSFSLLLIGTYTLQMKAGIGKEVIGKIALWSYSAYLWNNTIFRYFTLHPVPGPWILGVLVFLFCTFFVSWITYSWIELPGIHLRKRWMSS